MHIVWYTFLVYDFDLDYYGNIKNNLVQYFPTLLRPVSEVVYWKLEVRR